MYFHPFTNVAMKKLTVNEYTSISVEIKVIGFENEGGSISLTLLVSHEVRVCGGIFHCSGFTPLAEDSNAEFSIIVWLS